MTQIICIYNENCVRAGRAVPVSEIERNPDSWDWTEEDLTEENAQYHDDIGTPFHGRVADTIREALR